MGSIGSMGSYLLALYPVYPFTTLYPGSPWLRSKLCASSPRRLYRILRLRLCSAQDDRVPHRTHHPHHTRPLNITGIKNNTRKSGWREADVGEGGASKSNAGILLYTRVTIDAVY